VLIAVVVLVAVLVIAWFVAERIVRDNATTIIRNELTTSLGLESGHPMDIDLGSAAVLPQVIGGSFDTLDVSVDDVPIDDIVASVTFSAVDVPVDPSERISAVTATATVDESEIGKLGDSLSGIDVDSIALADGTVVATTTLSAFGFEVPVSAALEPSVSGGAIEFAPVSFTVNDSTLSLEQVRSGRFGGFVESLLPQQSFCVAEYLPESIVLDSAAVRGDQLVLGFTGEDVVLDDLDTPGSCG
jgi:hypothetical protein